MAAPAALQPIVAETVSRRAISRAWDGLLRLASSVREGWCPATEALERFGTAARGDPVHTAGEALGKLLRTVYLCDYLGNPSFRREILDLLNQGEAVHSLQRAIQQGPIGAKRGRDASSAQCGRSARRGSRRASGRRSPAFCGCSRP